jgi:carbon-monoxide dehydrogenase small subunit
MSRNISIRLNGEARDFSIAPDETLMNLLRRSGFVGVKNGCSDGACGSCAVIMDGCAVNACITFAFQAHGRDVQTIEGIGDFDHPHPMQKALVDTGGAQCGFCIPGFVMSVKALLDRNPRPGEEELKENLDGNICRCTGYEKIEDAIRKVIAES